MYRSENTPDGDIPDFSIMGGEGAYVVSGKISEGSDEKFYVNAEGNDELVDVWLSDQGASFPKKRICDSIEKVLFIAKWFYDFGELNPKENWS